MSAAKIQPDRAAPYQQDIDELLTALGTDARRGLTEKEARARLEILEVRVQVCCYANYN